EALLRKLWNSGLEMGASRLRTVPDCSSRTAAQAIPRREQIDELCAAGIAIPLDRDLFIHREAYEELVKATLDGLKAGESLDMAETKARTGFSRKYAIPFLNRMERDGWVKRDGDRRIVLKSEARSDSPSSKPALPRSPSSGLPNT
ncbi:MAG TPA: SelB C-terminal domain-containing protein, partial [Rectinemataceae bacterium]